MGRVIDIDLNGIGPFTESPGQTVIGTTTRNVKAGEVAFTVNLATGEITSDSINITKEGRKAILGNMNLICGTIK